MTDGWEIRNEFGAVRLEMVAYGRGTRLNVTSMRTGRSAAVDATILEAITSLPPARLVELVAVAVGDAPRGNETDSDQRPLK